MARRGTDDKRREEKACLVSMVKKDTLMDPTQRRHVATMEAK